MVDYLLILGLVFFSLGTLIGLRFLYDYWLGLGQGKVQSLILAAVLLIVGVQITLIGLIGDTIAANRRLTEEILYLQRRAANRDEREDDRSAT